MRTLLAILIVLAAAPGLRAEGAIAFGQGPNGAWAEAHTHNYATRDEAISAAMTSCNGRADGFACSLSAEFRSACAALATTAGSNGSGTAIAATENAARRQALRQCALASPSMRCVIRAAVCDTVDEADNRRKAIERSMYLGQWKACFGQANGTPEITSCRIALQYSAISSQDETAIRTQLSYLEQEQREREYAASVAREEERNRRLAAKRREEEECRQAEMQAERTRQARAAENQRLAEQRRFQDALDGCRLYIVARCDEALVSPQATAEDKTRLEDWRSTAVRYARSKDDCRAGQIAACNQALGSPALDAADLAQIENWRNGAAPLHKVAFALSAFFTGAATAITAIPASVARLPPSTQLASAIAVLFATALAIALVRLRAGTPRSSSAAPMSDAVRQEPVLPELETVSSSASTTPPPLPLAAIALRSAKDATPDLGAAAQRQPARVVPAPVEPTAAPPDATGVPHEIARTNSANLPAVIETPPPAVLALDTPAALRAMKLAHAYLAECEPSVEPGADNRPHRTTLSLAARQIDLALKADPNAHFEDQDGATWRVHELRARILLKEAMTYAADNIGKACAIAEAACDHDQTGAHVHFMAGYLNFEHRNRAVALRHLTRAAELDPDNIETLKLLDRAQHMSAAEIASYKGQHAGLKVANAGVKVYNTGVGIYNVGVFFWNLLVYTWRFITFPVRITDRIVGFIFRW